MPFVAIKDEKFSISSAACCSEFSDVSEDSVDESLESIVLAEVSALVSLLSMLLLISESCKSPSNSWIFGTRKRN